MTTFLHILASGLPLVFLAYPFGMLGTAWLLAREVRGSLTEPGQVAPAAGEIVTLAWVWPLALPLYLGTVAVDHWGALCGRLVRSVLVTPALAFAMRQQAADAELVAAQGALAQADAELAAAKVASRAAGDVADGPAAPPGGTPLTQYGDRVESYLAGLQGVPMDQVLRGTQDWQAWVNEERRDL